MSSFFWWSGYYKTMLLWTSTDCVKLPIRQMRRLGVCWFNNSVYFFLDKCDHCCYLITVWWRWTSIPEIKRLSSLLSWHVSCPLEKHVLWVFHCTPYSGKVLTSSWNVYFNIECSLKNSKISSASGQSSNIQEISQIKSITLLLRICLKTIWL